MKTVLSLIALCALSAAGCKSQPYSPDDPQANNKVPIIENTYEMVCVGKPPLSFVVTHGGWIKVMDATDKTLVHAAELPQVPNGFLIRIDPDAKAVTYTTMGAADNAEKPQIVQPIDPDHRFELYYQR